MCTVIGQFSGLYILLYCPLKFKAVFVAIFAMNYRQAFLFFVASASLKLFFALILCIKTCYLLSSDWHVLLSTYVRNVKPICMNRTCQTHCRHGLNNNYLNSCKLFGAINTSGDLRRNLNYTLLFMCCFMCKRQLQDDSLLISDLRNKNYQ